MNAAQAATVDAAVEESRVAAEESVAAAKAVVEKDVDLILYYSKLVLVRSNYTYILDQSNFSLLVRSNFFLTHFRSV